MLKMMYEVQDKILFCQKHISGNNLVYFCVSSEQTSLASICEVYMPLFSYIFTKPYKTELNWHHIKFLVRQLSLFPYIVTYVSKLHYDRIGATFYTGYISFQFLFFNERV